MPPRRNSTSSIPPLEREPALPRVEFEDEPISAEEEEAVAAAREEVARGDVIPHAEMLRLLGL